MPKFVFLWTDFLLWLIVAGTVFYGFKVSKNPNRRATWKRVFSEPSAMCAAIVLSVFLFLGLADAFHFLPRIDERAYATKAISPLDVLMKRQIDSAEKTYSAPLAYQSYSKEAAVVDGKPARIFPRLKFGGVHLTDPDAQWLGDIALHAGIGLLIGVLAGLLIFALCAWRVSRRHATSVNRAWKAMMAGGSDAPWPAVFWTVMVLCVIGSVLLNLMPYYHVFGTDLTGNDVLYQVTKSIHTALVMGTLTTAAILPFALILGVMSGYLQGWVDDIIQYFYTTISSVPSVLLIASCVLLIQVFIDKNPQFFQTSSERSDIKLLFLCLIIGVTEFAGMCRLIRGETLKLRELDYVQAAQAFGASSRKIMARHIVPNVMHVVIITLVLEFSGIVLYEAVLSYVGVGVDPSTNSFGTMINNARSEMARDPVVWWNLVTSFVFMLTMVLCVNLFADGVRDAFDPRARIFRPRLNFNAAAK